MKAAIYCGQTSHYFQKQGPTRHRPMAHPALLRYLSYSTTLTEHDVHMIWRAGTFLFLSVQLDSE